MGFGLARAPIERFRLMTEYIGLYVGPPLPDLADGQCEGVVLVVFGGGHGQAYDKRGPVVEGAGGEYKEGGNIAHLASGLGEQSIQIMSPRSGTQSAADFTPAIFRPQDHQ